MNILSVVALIAAIVFVVILWRVKRPPPRPPIS